jgi:hypothetical protein
VGKLRAAAKEAMERADSLAAEKAERERKAAEEQGKYEELYGSTKAELQKAREQLDALQAFRAQVEEERAARRATRLDALGDEWRKLIPDDAEGEALDRLLNIAEKAKAKAGAAPTDETSSEDATPALAKIPSGPGGAGNGKQPDAISRAERAWLQLHHPAMLDRPTAVQRKMLDKFGPNAGRKN